LFVSFRPTSGLGWSLDPSAAADKRRWFTKLLDDFGATAASTAEPRSARKYILSCQVPINGVDNGLETVLDVPYRATKCPTRVVGGNRESIKRRCSRSGQRLMGLRVFQGLDEGEVARELLLGRSL